MDCYIPLIPVEKGAKIETIRKFHELRQFVIFDEELAVHLTANSPQVQIRNFVVWINDAKVLQLQGTGSFERIEHVNENQNQNQNVIRWILASELRDSLFRSSVVMNNGYNNQIKFTVEYVEKKTIEPEIGDDDSEESEDLIPSFEALSPPGSEYNTPGNSSPAKSRSWSNDEMIKSVNIQFPIYSLVNMRLRNSLLKSRQCVISSLDFQTSKASLHFTEKYLNDGFKLEFFQVKYELVQGSSRCPLEPIRPFKVPFHCLAHDSFNVSYQLPLIPDAGTSPHRVKITLKYDLSLPEGKLPISTTWQTDVTLKKQPTLTSAQNLPTTPTSSLAAASRMYGLGSKLNLIGSTTSFMNNKLNDVKFKFLDKNITAYRGDQFSMTLQIVNSSLQPLDLVIYYNNKNPPPLSLGPTSAPNPFSLERQYQIYKRYPRTMEAVVLLSNDYKVPIIGPEETYFVQLRFVGIVSGYYSTLPGLKIVDLQKNELIEVGLGASIFIK